MSLGEARGDGEVMVFGGLRIQFDHRVLRPRPWTVAQSSWAAELAPGLPSGPVLELCAGAGQIGLAAIVGSERRLVCVDADPVAVGYTTRNARAAGLEDRVEVRLAELDVALAAEERFPLVIADPPWVPRADVVRYPEDPLTAINGGDDGLDVARSCLRVIGAHLLAPEGTALLQLGTAVQLAALADDVEAAGLCSSEVRRYDGGVVVRLGPVRT